MKLTVLRADPAGNITLFVMDPVEKARRGKVAEQLMAIERFHAEQVGFYCRPTGDADGHMEMIGGEFCGNATRAFGMLIAREKGGLSQVRIETSGCDHLVSVDVDLAAGTSRSEMPLPQSVAAVEVEGHPGTLVHLGGIAHLVVEGVEPSRSFFDKGKLRFRFFGRCRGTEPACPGWRILQGVYPAGRCGPGHCGPSGRRGDCRIYRRTCPTGPAGGSGNLRPHS